MSKSFYIDVTRCTACRGCQVACKQWHKLPAEETKNWGSFQNPADLSFVTYKLVRFSEQIIDDKLQWLFFPDQCRHCIDPPCVLQMENIDSGYIDEQTGAVIYTEKTRREDGQYLREACPYDIPRVDAETNIMSKCDMCLDRVHNGLLPACVQVCPTGAMNFGEREEMLELANARLAEARKTYPNAVLGDPEMVRTIYLFPFDPALFHGFAVAGLDAPKLLNRKQMFAKIIRPLRKHA